MTVSVMNINIEAMSTIGRGWGYDDEGNEVRFWGDHREMRNIGAAMQYASSDDPIVVNLEWWQIIKQGVV